MEHQAFDPNLSAAVRHTAVQDAHADALSREVGQCRTWSEDFLQALEGEFLADADERRMDLIRIAANRRCLAAQRALHSLFRKLGDGAQLTADERALAEHARDLVEAYAERRVERIGL
jgi:hypothetical protein